MSASKYEPPKYLRLWRVRHGSVCPALLFRVSLLSISNVLLNDVYNEKYTHILKDDIVGRFKLHDIVC